MTRRRDQIEFALHSETFASGGSIRTIHPVINGIRLAELAAPVERRQAQGRREKSLAGSYAGLADDRIRWPSRHFLGEPVLTWFEDGDTVLLGCTCGEWGCWPLTARVEVGADVVIWSNFRTGHRDWDLSDLGPFAFDRAQYESALSLTGASGT